MNYRLSEAINSHFAHFVHLFTVSDIIFFWIYVNSVVEGNRRTWNLCLLFFSDWCIGFIFMITMMESPVSLPPSIPWIWSPGINCNLFVFFGCCVDAIIQSIVSKLQNGMNISWQWTSCLLCFSGLVSNCFCNGQTKCTSVNR